MKQEFQGLGGQIHTNNSLCFVTASLEFVPLVHMNVGIVYLIHVGTSFKETTVCSCGHTQLLSFLLHITPTYPLPQVESTQSVNTRPTEDEFSTFVYKTVWQSLV